jgi:hypothetical protein
MPRARKYATSAERQQAYRDRVAVARRLEEERVRAEREARVERRRSASQLLGAVVLAQMAASRSDWCRKNGLPVSLRHELGEVVQALADGRVYRDVWPYDS